MDTRSPYRSVNMMILAISIVAVHRGTIANPASMSAGTESLQTRCWSKGDSNSRSHRERSGHGRAPYANGRTIARERSLSFRHLSSTARGTGSSNPLCSSGESHANLSFRGEQPRAIRFRAASPPRAGFGPSSPKPAVMMTAARVPRERGRFLWPSPADGIVAISAAQLAYMLDGIDWRNPVRTWRPEVAG